MFETTDSDSGSVVVKDGFDSLLRRYIFVSTFTFITSRLVKKRFQENRSKDQAGDFFDKFPNSHYLTKHSNRTFVMGNIFIDGKWDILPALGQYYTEHNSIYVRQL